MDLQLEKQHSPSQQSRHGSRKWLSIRETTVRKQTGDGKWVWGGNFRLASSVSLSLARLLLLKAHNLPKQCHHAEWSNARA